MNAINFVNYAQLTKKRTQILPYSHSLCQNTIFVTFFLEEKSSKITLPIWINQPHQLYFKYSFSTFLNGQWTVEIPAERKRASLVPQPLISGHRIFGLFHNRLIICKAKKSKRLEVRVMIFNLRISIQILTFGKI